MSRILCKCDTWQFEGPYDPIDLKNMSFDENRSKSISGQMDKASATETTDSGSIPGRVKPKL